MTIKINLLPQRLKVETKERRPASTIGLNRFLYLIPVIFAALLCLHLYLAVATVSKNSKLRSLTKKWEALAPQRKELDDFNKKYAVLSGDIQAIQKLSRARINWSQKLDGLSRELPDGIWFRQISVGPDNFVLRGSVISLQNQEMNFLKKFIEGLKKDSSFFDDFSNLEIDSAQRRSLGDYDVIDFVIAGKLKS